MRLECFCVFLSFRMLILSFRMLILSFRVVFFCMSNFLRTFAFAIERIAATLLGFATVSARFAVVEEFCCSCMEWGRQAATPPLSFFKPLSRVCEKTPLATKLKLHVN